MQLASEVVKVDSKIIVSLPEVKLTVSYHSGNLNLFVKEFRTY
jgi:hypothetical protein